jgi:hypothetical protein
MIESVSRRAFSGSSGTYNVRASELARDRRLKTLSATVVFLDDTQHCFQIEVMFSNMCQYISQDSCYLANKNCIQREIFVISKFRKFVAKKHKKFTVQFCVLFYMAEKFGLFVIMLD